MRVTFSTFRPDQVPQPEESDVVASSVKYTSHESFRTLGSGKLGKIPVSGAVAAVVVVIAALTLDPNLQSVIKGDRDHRGRRRRVVLPT